MHFSFTGVARLLNQLYKIKILLTTQVHTIMREKIDACPCAINLSHFVKRGKFVGILPVTQQKFPSISPCRKYAKQPSSYYTSTALTVTYCGFEIRLSVRLENIAKQI
jgi:hypothetical protein